MVKWDRAEIKRQMSVKELDRRIKRMFRFKPVAFH